MLREKHRGHRLFIPSRSAPAYCTHACLSTPTLFRPFPLPRKIGLGPRALARLQPSPELSLEIKLF